MSDLRVGVVGLGIGQMHLLSWLEVQGAPVTMIADVDEQRRARAAQDWGVPAVDSLDALLAAGVDVVDLCTPPSMHEAQIEQCLAAGAHVICEKPLVDSVAACDRLRVVTERALATSGARLMPVLQYRFGDGALRARAGRRGPHRPAVHGFCLHVVAPRTRLLRRGALAWHLEGRARRVGAHPLDPHPRSAHLDRRPAGGSARAHGHTRQRD